VLTQAAGPVFRSKHPINLISTAALVVLIGLPITTANAQTVPSLRSPGSANGCPYVDPNTAPGRIEELKARIEERNKAINKTKSMLPGLESGSKKAWSKADQIMSDAPANLVTGFASDYMTTMSSIKNRIKALRNSGASKEKVEMWLKSMKGLEDAGSFLKKAPASFNAGNKFAIEHQAEIGNFQKEVTRTHDFLVNSGLAEEVGGSFAKELGGPLGKLAFDAGVMSIDLMATTEEAFIEADAARRVQSSIDAMEWARDRDESEMFRLRDLMADNCKPSEEQHADSGASAEPPPPAVAKEAPAPSAPASTAPAVDMGPAILVGGAAAAAGLAAVALGGLSTSESGVDCGAAPQGFGGAWYTEYSSWCSCMGGTASTANGVECIR